MIWKKSEMDLDTSATILGKKLQEEGIPGKWGDQDRWWADVDGQDATLYTGYYDEGRPDALGAALRASCQTGEPVVISKGFDKKKNRAKYQIVGGGNAPQAVPTQTPKAAPANTQAPKQDTPTPRSNGRTPREVKEAEIGMFACCKAASGISGIKTVDDLFNKAEVLFKKVERFASLYNPDLLELEERIRQIDDQEDFISWLCSAYKVKELNELTPAQLDYTVKHFDSAAAKWQHDVDAAATVQEDHREEPFDEPEAF